MKKTIFLTFIVLVTSSLLQAYTDKGQPISSLPYTINQPGNYYLTDNLTFNGSAGIEINADNVTLDLNGCTIEANSGGIGVDVEAKFARIHNGRIYNCDTGIYFDYNAYGSIAENLDILNGYSSYESVKILSENTQLRSCRIINDSFSGSGNDGMISVNGAGVEIRNCILISGEHHGSGYGNGIYANELSFGAFGNRFYNFEYGLNLNYSGPDELLAKVANNISFGCESLFDPSSYYIDLGGNDGLSFAPFGDIPMGEFE